MSGIKYSMLAAALIGCGLLLHSKSDRLVSGRMIEMVSAVQVYCNRHSRTVGGVDVGCKSFADVRKIDMRSDNRNRALGGNNIVQIGR